MNTMSYTVLSLAIICLTVIAITAMLTGHDGMIVNAVVGAICTVAGYAIARKRNGNGKS